MPAASHGPAGLTVDSCGLKRCEEGGFKLIVLPTPVTTSHNQFTSFFDFMRLMWLLEKLWSTGNCSPVSFHSFKERHCSLRAIAGSTFYGCVFGPGSLFVFGERYWLVMTDHQDNKTSNTPRPHSAGHFLPLGSLSLHNHKTRSSDLLRPLALPWISLKSSTNFIPA